MNLLSVIILKHLMNLTDLLLMPEPEFIFFVLWMGTVSGEAPFDEDLLLSRGGPRVPVAERLREVGTFQLL